VEEKINTTEHQERGMEEREHLMDLQHRSGGEERLQDLLESSEGEGKAPRLTRN